MTEGVRLLIAFALAAGLTAITTPVAIWTARRAGFFDEPAGYKAHARPTPYLGGLAVLAAWLPAILVSGAGLGHYWPLVLGTLSLAAVGTVDDRVNLSPWLRVAAELLAAWFLWREGLGWSVGSGAANLALTAFWVVGIVNAFNLMDNLDGAATTVAGVAALGLAALAAIGEDLSLAVIALGLGGALAGFLPHNLARPARIFLGDGGSMAVGFLLAGGLMAAPMGKLSGWPAVAAAALVVGLPIFDTTLVVLSRRRRGVPVLSGATDHTTHRLRVSLKSPAAVCAVLALGQLTLCGLAIEATRLGRNAAIVLVCLIVVLGGALVIVADGSWWAPISGDP